MSKLKEIWRKIYNNAGLVAVYIGTGYVFIQSLLFWTVCKFQEWQDPMVVAAEFNKMGYSVLQWSRWMMIASWVLAGIAMILMLFAYGFQDIVKSLPGDMKRLHLRIKSEMQSKYKK